MFEVELESGPVEVTLLHPTSGDVAGRWRFPEGGRRLLVDFLDPTLCSVDGTRAAQAELEQDFIAWPRMTFTVNGRPVELVSQDREVLRRHYGRPQHQEVSYVPGPPDPWVEAFHQARLRQVRRLMQGVSGRVLDVGSGYSLLAMAGPWPFELFACDRDGDAVRWMCGNGAARAVHGSAEEIPFRAGTFDAVFAGEIIEHLVDRQEALRGWVDVLRPGGRLVLTTPNRRHLMARLTGVERVQNPEHLFEYSAEELRTAITIAGAHVERVEGLNLAIPVYVPGKGWRDLVHGVRRRWMPPQRVVDRLIPLGRRLPAVAPNLAVVARRV